MGSKERRDREKSQTRQLILDAARALFTELGFEAVTMRMIAEKIEYSPTAIYVHFADKQSLMRELSALDFRSLSAAVLRAQKVEEPLERIHRLGHAYLAFALEHPNSYQLLFMTKREPMLAKAIEPGEFEDPERSAYAMLREAVRYAIAKKAFAPQYDDADLVAQLLWSAMHGLIALQACMPKGQFVPWRPIKKSVGLMMNALLSGLSPSR
jgi:AcrR family transcriptional regulator